ncbi:hypothetical protein B0H99_103200 [Planomicrobium soli]|uniref:Cyclophilin-like domain-containing protein n=1 Tax=Planomicrobium soli TaxID=1176648 RepID=A0A2P8H4B1_9BACL|nr:cyclophilin-like fold protein [Planomicrobium soli]PSL41066.1 hypothetical protein B0H99_103200 [Planomicrobium soli]
MKIIFLILCIFMFCFSLTACSASQKNETEETDTEEMQKSKSNAKSEKTVVEEGQSSEINQEREEADMSALLTINIKIGDEIFLAKLYDNRTTQALVELLPLRIRMEDLHRNEKFYYLPDSLPTDSESPGVIKEGEIMLYGDNCLVLFYEKFSTSFNYTRLGYIEDVERFAQAVGAGDINVVLDLAENNK